MGWRDVVEVYKGEVESSGLVATRPTVTGAGHSAMTSE